MPCNAEENTHRFKVDVSVQASDHSIKSRIESCLKKELRSLHDVTVTNDSPDYVLGITALEVETEARNAIGIAIAVSTVEPYKSEGPSEAFPENVRYLFKIATRGHVYDHGMQLLITASDELPNACNTIVAEFDVAQLEKKRNTPKPLTDSEVNELIDKQMKQK